MERFPNTRRLTRGFCTFLGSNLISWSAEKQNSVSKSSTGAEYRTPSDTEGKIIGLANLLREIGVPQPLPPEFY